MKKFVLISFVLGMGLLVRAESFNIIYTFPDLQSGYQPWGLPYIGPGGILYGTTAIGGITPCIFTFTLGCGTVFSLTPPVQPGGTWTEAVLYNFQGGKDGAVPDSGVLPGPNGTLLGTTGSGGRFNGACIANCGTFFQLTPPAQVGQVWTEQVLFEFPPADRQPLGLAPASNGTYVGASALGGNKACNLGCGSLYELLPPGKLNASWTLSTLHWFSGGAGGATPNSPLAAGPGGVFYGTVALGGGTHSSGGVFVLMPPLPPSSNWTVQPLYMFGGVNDGYIPESAVVVASDGTLYGTTYLGGGMGCLGSGCGTVYSLTPPAQAGGKWTENVIYRFQGGNDGSHPGSSGPSLVLAPGGVLYGITTAGGGTGCNGVGCGVLYKLTPPAVAGGAWTETILHAFSGGSDGMSPMTPAIDATGVLYGFALGGTGTACNGGGCGVVYQYVP